MNINSAQGRLSGPLRSLGAMNLLPGMLWCCHHFPEGKNSNVSYRSATQQSGFLLCCPQCDSSVTAAATSCGAADWGKAAPLSSSHHYTSSQFKLAPVAEAATFLPNFRSSGSVFPLLFSARKTKLSLTSPERSGWWLAARGWKEPHTHPTWVIPDNLTNKMKLNS